MTNQFKQNEIRQDGTIPVGWQLSTLGECAAKPDYGVTASASFDPNGSKFLRITDIQDGIVDWDDVPYCDAVVSNGDKLLKRDDIIVARIGATTGKAYLIQDCPTAIFASYLIRVRADTTKINPRFLYNYFQTTDYWQHIEKHKDDRLKGGVNIPALTSLPIPVPSLSEQAAIADVLALVRLAIGLEKQTELVARKLKHAAMWTLFTRGLSSGGQRETEFGLVPDAWKQMSLDRCAEIQTGAAKGRKFADDDAVEVPYLRVANVQDGHLDLTEMKKIRIRGSEVDRYRLRPGDVVLTEGGDFDKLGRGFIWRGELDLCVHQNHVFAVRTDRDRLVPEFFAYLAQSAYGKAYFLKVAHKTTNLACINSAKLKAFPALIPSSLEEQREIASILDAIDRKIDLHRRKRAVLDELFKALLHKLMTGEIRVGDLDISALVPEVKDVAA